MKKARDEPVFVTVPLHEVKGAIPVARNNVFAAPMINSFILRNTKMQPSTIDDNIFTDMLEKKAKFNMPLLCVDGDLDAFRQHNNCYLTRDAIPLDRRAMISPSTTAQSAKHLIDPLFAGLPELMPEVTAKLDGRPDFSTDRMMDAILSLDFHSFFATNPEVVKRGLGLEPGHSKTSAS